MHPNVHSSVFVVAKTWKTKKQQQQKNEGPFNRRLDQKMRHIYTVKYDSATRRQETLPFAITWIGLEMSMLSERSQKSWERCDLTHVGYEIERNKWTRQTETHGRGQQYGGYQRGREGVDQGKRGRICGDGRKFNSGRRTHNAFYI